MNFVVESIWLGGCFVADSKMSDLKNEGKPNLYLVGFMGTGKSAVGRSVAQRLGFEFIDSDHEIERTAGKTIPEIFESVGEAGFREMEKQFMENGHRSNGMIVSCGGGLIAQPGMLELVKSMGPVVCLLASVETIYERTSKNSNRPLLQTEDPKARIRELLSEREPIYRKAGTEVLTDGRSINEVVSHVVRIYKRDFRSFGSKA